MSNTVDLHDRRALTGISKELHDVVRTAAELDWRAKRASRGGLTLLSPDGESTVYIPLGKQDTTLPTRLAREVIRKTPSAQVDDTLSRLESAPDDAVESIAGALVQAQGALGVRPGSLMPLTDGPGGRVVGDAEVTSVDGEGITVTGTITDPEMAKAVRPRVGGLSIDTEVTPVNPGSTGKTLVSQRPYLARKGRKTDGQVELYESSVMDERVWSDGSKTYVCNYPDCGFENASPMGVAGHRQRHPAYAKPGPTVGLSDKPTADSRAVTRLAREIEAGMRAQAASGESMPLDQHARLIAEHIVAKRRERGEQVGHHEPEPLTADDIVQKVRAMVAADLIRQMDNLVAQVAELSAKEREAEQRATKAEARAGRLSSALATMATLAQEEAGEADDASD